MLNVKSPRYVFMLICPMVFAFGAKARISNSSIIWPFTPMLRNTEIQNYDFPLPKLSAQQQMMARVFVFLWLRYLLFYVLTILYVQVLSKLCRSAVISGRTLQLGSVRKQIFCLILSDIYLALKLSLDNSHVYRKVSKLNWINKHWINSQDNLKLQFYFKQCNFCQFIFIVFV